MGWLERLGRVVRTQIDSLVKETEDPEKILEQAVMGMEQELIEMRRALAEAIATQKSSERQSTNYQMAAQKWYARAQVSLEKENEALAREALMQRQSYLERAKALQTHLEQQTGVIGQVKKDLRSLEQKYLEAKAKKNLYLVRLRSASATRKLHEISSNLNGTSSVSVFEQLETKILELEAESELMNAPLKDSLDEKFTAIEGEKGSRL
jgi:phage shock protein A